MKVCARAVVGALLILCFSFPALRAETTGSKPDRPRPSEQEIYDLFDQHFMRTGGADAFPRNGWG